MKSITDLCRLCKTSKVYNIKSHLTPAGITVNTFGERNKEKIYTIDVKEKVIDKYYGCEYHQEETTEVKDAPNSRKGIFCQKCEDNLKIFEDAVQFKLIALINEIGKGGNKSKTKLDVKYIDIKTIHPNILVIYFLSVVWRQCLEQILDNYDNPLTQQQFEDLRLFLVEKISTPISTIKKDDLITKPKLLIFTTYNTKIIEACTNPNSTVTNPLIFYIGSISLLYWLDGPITQDFEKITFLNSSLLDDDLLLINGRMAIVQERIWKKLFEKFAKGLANKYLNR